MNEKMNVKDGKEITRVDVNTIFLAFTNGVAKYIDETIPHVAQSERETLMHRMVATFNYMENTIGTKADITDDTYREYYYEAYLEYSKRVSEGVYHMMPRATPEERSPILRKLLSLFSCFLKEPANMNPL